MENMMENVNFALKLHRIQFRMMFGGKHRYRKEYDAALDAVGERGHWLYLYDALEGPKADEVCEALKKWVEANQELRSIQPEDKDKWVHWKAWMIEGQLKRKLDALIYGEE
jgi:hypothetical protein